MKALAYIYIVTFSFFCIHKTSGQIPLTYDSLLARINTTTNDTLKAWMYHNLSGMYLNSNAYLAKFYANKSLEIFERNNHTPGIAMASVKIAAACRQLNEESKFIQNIKIALSIGEKTKNDYVLAACYHEMGLMYNSENDLENALKCNLKALELRKKLKQEKEFGGLMNNIGILYAKKNQWNEAVNYFRSAYELEKRRKDNVATGNALNNLGIYYIIKNQVDSAEYFIREGKKWRVLYDDQLGLAGSYNNLALLCLQKNQTGPALVYADSSYAISKKLNSRVSILEVLETYYSIYEAKKDFQNALHYFKEREELRKKIETETHNTRLQQVQSGIDMEAKEKELLESNLHLKEKEAESNKRNFFLILALVGLGLCGFIIYYVIKANKKIKEASQAIAEQKHLVEEKQKEILDSIRYAHRIQRALMPSEKYIRKSLDKNERI